MKKLMIVLAVAALLGAPTVLAETFNRVSADNETELEVNDPTSSPSVRHCVNFHAGNEVEELHESATAKIHENDDNVCPTGSPTATSTASPTESPTGSPTETPTSSPTESPTGSPTETPTATPTASPTESPTASPLAGTLLQGPTIQGLLQQLIDLLKNLVK